mgnify:FL=1
MTKEDVENRIVLEIRAFVWDELNKSKDPDFLGPCALGQIEGIVIDNFKKLEGN